MVSLKTWQESIVKASERISPYIEPSPLLYSVNLSKQFGCNVWLKLECNNLSGSFKIRGAFNKSIQLAKNSHDEQCPTKIVCASSGNHASACCEAFKRLKLCGVLFIPESITLYKKEKFKHYSDFIDVEIFGQETCQSEKQAREYANRNHLPYLSPYNDFDVICGQGTISVEIIKELPHVDAVFVPCGGGGLLGGVSVYFKSVSHPATIIGCQPELDAVMYHSVKAGRILSYDEAGSRDTICQATAGGIEEGALTFELCRNYVDQWTLSSEYDVAKALQNLGEAHPELKVEPSCALPLVGLRKTFHQWTNKTVVLIVSSRNVGDVELAAVEEILQSQ